jgi:hypothetical protein
MGDAAATWVAGLAPQPVRYGSVAAAWDDLLPAGLRVHCRIDAIRGGCLKVAVDGPCYLYELQLCKEELLGELQRACPGARVSRIDVAIRR